MIGNLRARLWLNIALVGMVLALGLWAAFGSHESGEKQESLTALKPEEVQRILVLRPQFETVELARTETGWNLRRAGDIAANPGQVDTLLALLSAPVLSRYPVKSLQLSEVGLEPPALVIEADGKRIELGGVNELSVRRYTRVDEEVRLIPDQYEGLLTTAPVDFASPKLVPLGKKLSRLTLPGLAIERGEKGWHRAGEKEAKADASLDTLAQHWEDTYAVALSESAEGEALTEVLLGFEDGGELHYLILAAEPELVLGRSDVGVAFHVSAERTAELMPPAPASTPTESPAAPAAEPKAEAAPATESKAEPVPATGPAASPSATGTAPSAKPSTGSAAQEKAPAKPAPSKSAAPAQGVAPAATTPAANPSPKPTKPASGKASAVNAAPPNAQKPTP